MKGVDIIVLVNTGDDAEPVWTPVGGQRNATLSESTDTVETTHKLTGRYKTYDYSHADWTISADGLYIDSDTGYQALVTALREQELVKVRWQEGGTATFEGDALVTSRDLEGPYDGEATYSVEFQGSGDPVLTPTP